MNQPTVPSHGQYSLTVWPDGICQLQPHLPLSGALVETIATEVERLLERSADIRGLLLDMRESTPLSIVRLSELIDRLGTFHLPVAVLFSDVHYQETATLLHPTLVRQPRVAYYVDPDEARAYLLNPPNGNNGTPPPAGS